MSGVSALVTVLEVEAGEFGEVDVQRAAALVDVLVIHSAC